METLQLPEGSVTVKSSGKKGGNNNFSPRFEVQERLAEGGTSELYLARDTFVGSTCVVLKRIHQGLLQSASTCQIAARELALARQLSHPNLIHVYDLRKGSKTQYLVMEYLPGASLKDLLSRRRVDYSLAISIFRPLIRVVGYLHRQGVVHSDIKPSNIMVTQDNRVKLIDLANCRRDSRCAKPAVLVDDDHFFGYSLDYSSPQVISDQPATTSDDVFSLACVLYELLAGRSPIPAKKGLPDRSLASVTKPASINYWQWKILKKGMAVDQRQRYQAADTFFKRFVLARYWLPLFVCSLLLLSALGVLGFNTLAAYAAKAPEHIVDQQQGSIEDVIERVRSQPPLERYQSLYHLQPFSELQQRGALAMLYSDVLDPIVDFVQDEVARPHRIPDFDQLHNRVDAALLYYPYSKDLGALKDVLVKEQKVFIDNLTFRLSNIVSGGEYTVAKSAEVATIFEKLAKLGVSSRAKLLDKDYGEYYASLIYHYAQAGDWHDLHEAYGFAQGVRKVLPEFAQAWLGVDGKVLENSRLLADYIVNSSAESVYPESAVEALLAERLSLMAKDISSAWYNKDLDRLAKELLLLKKRYSLPEQFMPYQHLRDALAKKIQQKIQYFKRKNQKVSVDRLAGLLNKLTQ